MKDSINPSDSDERQNPKLVKDLIKLRQLELKIEETALQKQSLRVKRRRFKAKDFFMYIFPALIQAVTIYAAYVAVVKSRFFEAANYYAEGRNLRLKMDEDSLKNHKSKLHDSISKLSLNFDLEKNKLHEFMSTNARLDSTNSNLKKDIQQKTELVLNLGASYYYNLVSSYQKNFDHWQNETIEFLKRQSHLKSRDPILIKAQIDGGLKVEIKDTSERMLTRLRLSAVGFFCFKNQVYRQLFLNYLHLYINYLSVHSNDEKYDSSFLDIMRHRDWGEKDINENYSILFNEALKTKESNKLSQVASWATFHPFESLESEKIVLLPMYWPKMHQYLLQANIMLFLNDTLPMKDLRLFQMMKDEETSLLCECPQCYISLEAEVLHKYFKQFKDMDTITNAVPINIVLRKNDDHVEINDVDYLAKVRLPALLRTTDLKDFSQKLLRKYQKMVAANDVISFDLMGNSEHFDNETKKFELYYQKNQAKFKYWLSPDRINDINKDEFQTKLLNLKL